MRNIRFTISSLLVAVLFVGVGFAALREANEIWDSSIFSLTLGMLSISILLAVHRTDKRQAFWLGFALFGSTYLALSLVPSIESRLITTKALAFLDSKEPRSIPASDDFYDLLVVNDSQPIALNVTKGTSNLIDMPVVSGSKPWFPTNLAGPSLTASSGTTENFVWIGHSLVTLIAAILGGLLSRRLHAGNRERATGLPSIESGLQSSKHPS